MWNFIIKFKLALIVFLIFDYNISDAQIESEHINIKWGNEVKCKQNEILRYLDTLSFANVFVTQHKSKILFYIFNKNNQFVKKIKIKFPKFFTELSQILTCKDKIYVFYREYRKAGNLVTFSCMVLDSTGVILVDKIASSKRNADLINPNFKVIASDSNILIWHLYNEYRNSNHSFLSFKYFNHALKLEFNKVIELQMNSNLIDVLRFEKFKDKNILTARVFDKIRKERKNFKPNYTIVFFVLNDKYEIQKQFDINLDKIYIQNMRYKIIDSCIEAVGFCNNKLNQNAIGTYFFKQNIYTNQKWIQYHSLPQLVPKKEYHLVKMNIQKLEPFAYFHTDYLIQDMDKRLMLTEQFFVFSADVGSKYTKNVYYGDMYLQLMNDTGLVIKYKRILKAQATYNNYGEYSSYYIARHQNCLVIVFNDHKDNKNPNPNQFQNKLLYHSKKAALHGYFFDTQTLNYKEFWGPSSKDMKCVLKLQKMMKISNNQTLVVAKKGKKLVLGELTFNSISCQ